MIDREGRVVFGSVLAFVLARAGTTVVDRQFGTALGDAPLVSFLLCAGVAVALPQLYLASTGAEARPRSRLRFVAAATATFAVAFAAHADGTRYLAIGTVGTASLLAALGYEALAGYRAASTGA
jgi:hypothetical protein